MENIEQLGDRELYEKCQFFGANARKWARKFAALLPEVDRRHLYKKYKFYSIFEFAAKLAGLGRDTVVDILWVGRKLHDKPLLKALMAEQGWAKLRVVATVATQENEKILAEKVKIMSKPTLETFIKELRQQNHPLVQSRPRTADGKSGAAENQQALAIPARIGDEAHATADAVNAVHKPDAAAVQGLGKTGSPAAAEDFFGEASQAPRSATPPRISVRMPLKPETELRLRQLQKKLSREASGPVDFNEVLETLLDSYDELAYKSNATAVSAEKLQKNNAQAEEKIHDVEKIEKVMRGKVVGAAPTNSHREKHTLQELEALAKAKALELETLSFYGATPSRHFPAVIEKFLSAKFQNRCAYEGCMKLPEIFHHTRRYSLNQSHDPDFLVPLCKEHEHLAHFGLIENEEQAPPNWRLKIFPDENSPKFEIDKKVNRHRVAV